jgi:hypothetical protein
MDTKPLERFATRARRDLLSSVDARATAVLAAGSVARAERPEVVRNLEAEITAHGREYIIDKVAYTWFNRIIALRFMDARGYTSAGIVSPAQGQTHGQPEIITEAKRGNVDGEVVVDKITSETILSLLDGSRRSTDAEGEAYALLLTAYCRHWHKSMSFMFEREGDYTELLVPAGLLADGAIIACAREVLTEPVCDDVEVIGWLYQFYISERKQDVFDGFSAKGSARKLAGPAEIPAATQLFTPHWIVRYLVENSLGRLWMLNRPTSRLVDHMAYYIAPIDEEAEFLAIAGPEQLTVIDPACGSGHMLTYAFDLLYAIYEEEGYAPADIPSLILTHNLHGTEIDHRAGALAAFALAMKARARQRSFFGKHVEPRIFVIEPISFSPGELEMISPGSSGRDDERVFWNQFRNSDSLGSLIRPDIEPVSANAGRIATDQREKDLLRARAVANAEKFLRQAEALGRQYAVVVANPPYMGSANMGAELSAFLERNYTAGKGDLMTAFMMRAEAFTVPGGRWAMINIPTWMFLGAYQQLRHLLLDGSTVQSLLHLGRGAFGADFGSVAFVVRKNLPGRDSIGVYRKLFEEHVEIRSIATIENLFLTPGLGYYEIPQHSLRTLPGAQIAYWVDPGTLQAFDGPELTLFGVPRTGIDSGNNELHYRFWWEVSAGSILRDIDALPSKDGPAAWALLQRGGDRRRWYGNVDSVVSVGGGASSVQQYSRPSLRNVQSYFKQAVSWNRLSNGRFYPRFVDPGTAFDDGSPFATPTQTSVEILLGALASAPVRHMLGLFNQGRKTEVGHVSMLPWPANQLDEQGISDRVSRLVEIARHDWNRWETSPDFVESPVISTGLLSISQAIAEIESEMDSASAHVATAEIENDAAFIDGYGMDRSALKGTGAAEVTLTGDLQFTYGSNGPDARARRRSELVKSLVSYAVGCVFGRYTLEEPGLILADQGAMIRDYLAKVPSPVLPPDLDSVIPFVDDGWFEDDVVERIRRFLRVAFGTDHFEENLRFVEESLGVKTLRDYFITKAGKSRFYDDHVQRYKKRPIYWMFSSPKGSFNALIYMHRYNPSTVSTVLNEYLREYRAKLEVALANADRSGTAGSSADQKEADRLRKVLSELNDYEHDVLYPLATQQLVIDLDDGVKENYPKFYPALRKIPGLEATG